jgi:Zn-dependent peptidase ImmA (M78 family)
MAWAELTWEVAAALQTWVRLPPPEIPECAAPQLESDIELLALQVRQLMGIPSGPVSNVVRCIEARGVVTTRLVGSARAVDAFSQVFPDRPMVLLNPLKQDKARARLDAAHELGHLVMHHDADPGGHLVERQAMVFGAAFLMPADEIRNELPLRPDWDELIALKRRWGVSLGALLYRGRQVGVYKENTYRSAMTSLSSQGWRTSEPAPLGEPESPALLGAAAIRASRRGITVTDIARLAALPEGLVVQLIQEAAAEPLPRAFLGNCAGANTEDDADSPLAAE